MHAALIFTTLCSTLLATALAFPRTQQRPLSSGSLPHHTWDASFDGCKSEGFFHSPNSCKAFYRCARATPGSSELVKYQFECPADQIFCRSLIACVHPWACAEECTVPVDQGRERASMKTGMARGQGGKQCKNFRCERPGTFVDTHDCSRFHECESYWGEGELKLLDTVGDCPRGEIFCPIVNACGPEAACPQKCDRSCQ